MAECAVHQPPNPPIAEIPRLEAESNQHNLKSQDGRGACLLKSFPVGLLGSLWPASRWVVGIKVNSWVSCRVCLHACYARSCNGVWCYQVRKELLENATALLRCTGYRRQDKGKVDAERIGNDLVLAKGNVHLEMQAGSSGRYAGLVAGNRGLPCSELLCGLEQGLDGEFRTPVRFCCQHISILFSACGHTSSSPSA
eukprot:1309710-Rhodomonas_salina.2